MALPFSAASLPSANPASAILPHPILVRRLSANPNLSVSPALRRDALTKEALSLPSEAGGIWKRCGGGGPHASHLCEQARPAFDSGSLAVGEAASDDELRAAVRLRVRTFFKFNDSYGIEDYKAYVAKREFEGLKDRISGKTTGFKRVSCINATLPVSTFGRSADELCSVCKFLQNEKEQIVVGTLDINWCHQLPDELTGKRPEGVGADLTRAYLSNVCVARELQRNGLGYALIAKSKEVAYGWGITDLYIHVAVDNEAANKLYSKSGFVYESEELAQQARFLGRPRRYLLWANLGN